MLRQMNPQKLYMSMNTLLHTFIEACFTTLYTYCRICIITNLLFKKMILDRKHVVSENVFFLKCVPKYLSLKKGKGEMCLL